MTQFLKSTQQINSRLHAAKQNKNDEFYTQLPDIEQELNRYKDQFKNKIVFCNCDDPYESNFFQFFAMNFKKLQLKQLITTSYKPSPVANTQLALFGDGKVINTPNGRKKVTANKFIINEVHDMDGDGSINLRDMAEQLKANKNNEWTPLEGTGDFRSPECTDLLKQADIVVTNPPFSLFRDYLTQIIQYNKKFLIIGNKGSTIYKETFQLIKDNKLWLGYRNINSDMWFVVPEGAKYEKVVDGKKIKHIMACWFTNLDTTKRQEIFRTGVRYMPGKYSKYENYNAINIDKVTEIPDDYNETMGVPITFLDKYSPNQFEIIWQASGNTRASAPKEVLERLGYVPHSNDRGGCGIVGGKRVYSRVFIRRKVK